MLYKIGLAGLILSGFGILTAICVEMIAMKIFNDPYAAKTAISTAVILFPFMVASGGACVVYFFLESERE